MYRNPSIAALIIILALALSGCCGAPSRPMPGSDNGGVGGIPPTVSPETVRRLASVYMVDASTGWAVAACPTSLTSKETAVLKTTDGGKRWTDITPPVGAKNTWVETAALVDASCGWVVMGEENATSMTVFRTADGGKSWTSSTLSWQDDRKGPAIGARIVFPDVQHGWLLVSHGIAAASNWVDVYVSRDGDVLAAGYHHRPTAGQTRCSAAWRS